MLQFKTNIKLTSTFSKITPLVKADLAVLYNF